jgi:hypothetical protein
MAARRWTPSNRRATWQQTDSDWDTQEHNCGIEIVGGRLSVSPFELNRFTGVGGATYRAG